MEEDELDICAQAVPLHEKEKFETSDNELEKLK